MNEIILKDAKDNDFLELAGKAIGKISTDGSNAGITDAALAVVSQIVGLQELDLEWADRITDTGLGYLSDARSLRYLDISFCKGLTSAGIDKLKSKRPDLEIES
ncbi:hypothetical protein [Pleionea mediterranea]|nr:hypothetical protein [Pleionea mediterranea]